MPSPPTPERELPVRLVLLGPHTRVVASLCASCPSGPAGCCSVPPDLSWTDIARISALAGADWLLAEIQTGHLRRGPRGLIVATPAVAPTATLDSAARKCVYHAAQGCSIPPERRSAACNYYVCDDALSLGGLESVGAEAARAAWTAQYATWDEILSAEVGSWAGRPDSPADDLRLFEHLGRRFAELVAAG